MDLHGQRVVILGGTSGIGLATAKAAARCGAEVTVISRQPASIDRALAELPPGTRGRAADLTDPGLVCRLFADLGDIDHLVFTAGEPLALIGLATLDLDRAREFFNLRYFGALWAAHAAVPHLQPGGSITEIEVSTNTMEDFCLHLEDSLDRLVVDETHLKGRYSFAVRDDSIHSTDEFLQKLREQTGLVLAPDRRNVTMLVVRPT